MTIPFDTLLTAYLLLLLSGQRQRNAGYDLVLDPGPARAQVVRDQARCRCGCVCVACGLDHRRQAGRDRTAEAEPGLGPGLEQLGTTTEKDSEGGRVGNTFRAEVCDAG